MVLCSLYSVFSLIKKSSWTHTTPHFGPLHTTIVTALPLPHWSPWLSHYLTDLPGSPITSHFLTQYSICFSQGEFNFYAYYMTSLTHRCAHTHTQMHAHTHPLHTRTRTHTLDPTFPVEAPCSAQWLKGGGQHCGVGLVAVTTYFWQTVNTKQFTSTWKIDPR